MSSKPQFQTRIVKYSFGNKPDEAQIAREMQRMADQGYRLINRSEKSPGCLGSISSTIFGGGRTSLMFELKNE